MPPGVTRISTGIVFELVVVEQFLGQSLLERRRAVACHVVGVAGVHCLGGSQTNILGRNEIGIATTEIDDIDPLRLQFARLIRDGNCRRWRGGFHPRGQKIGDLPWFRLHPKLLVRHWRIALPASIPPLPASVERHSDRSIANATLGADSPPEIIMCNSFDNLSLVRYDAVRRLTHEMFIAVLDTKKLPQSPVPILGLLRCQ